MTGATPSQTVGPFLHLVLSWPDGPEVVAAGTAGSVVITGRLLDGAGDPVTDGLVETWQADTDGHFDHPDDPRGPAAGAFRGFGRCATDEQGSYRIRTVKPGALPAEDGHFEAPHLNVSVFARGLLNRLVTRIYFPDESAANAADPVLASLEPHERDRLVARAEPDGTLRFDVHLQGPDETPFFDV